MRTEIIERIRAHHKSDRFAIKQQSRADRSLEAFVVFDVIGLRRDADEPTRKKTWLTAKKIIGEAIQGASEDLKPTASPISGMVAATRAGRAGFDRVRATHEKAMVKEVKQLPITAWATGVKGLGLLSLARIIGEAGDPANYPDKSKLWKRMGLAVLGGNRQGNPGKGASADDWIAHGYNAERRSVMFIVGENLIRAKSPRYYPVYLQRKEYEAARGLSKIHAHNRAKRYIEKKLLADLWRAWRRADQIRMPERASDMASPADSIPRQEGLSCSAMLATPALPAGAEPIQRREGLKRVADPASCGVPPAADYVQVAIERIAAIDAQLPGPGEWLIDKIATFRPVDGPSQ